MLHSEIHSADTPLRQPTDSYLLDDKHASKVPPGAMASAFAARGLSADQRYSRQTLFSGIGAAGQERLSQAHVLIVGCGALGSVLANSLARAGVGYLRLVDRDFVEGNNLQRQVLYDEHDALDGLPKAIAAERALHRINSLITIDAHVADVTPDAIESLLDGIDVVLDGTDNFETRYLLNDACVKAGIPWIYSGVIAAYGVTLTVLPGETACLRCVFPERPLPGTTATCDTAGVLNGIVGVITGMASTEAIKLLVGSDRLVRGLTWVDLWENTFERVELPAWPTAQPAASRSMTIWTRHWMRVGLASVGGTRYRCVRHTARPPRSTCPRWPSGCVRLARWPAMIFCCVCAWTASR